MTMEDILVLARRAGIEQGIDGAWIAMPGELQDFAVLISEWVKGKVCPPCNHNCQEGRICPVRDI